MPYIHNTKDGKQVMRRGRLNLEQRRRLVSLLNMMYTPEELARETSIPLRRIKRNFLKNGCPHVKDNDGQVMINGEEFRTWLDTFYLKKQKLGTDEAYCVCCLKGVVPFDTQIIQKEEMTYLLGNCPDCERRVSRFLAHHKESHYHDQS
jgi:hypothetical protein